MTSLSGSQGYIQARDEAKNIDIGNSGSLSSPSLESTAENGPHVMRNVDDRPYFPLLRADPSDEASVLEVAKVIVLSRVINGVNEEDAAIGDVATIDGDGEKNGAKEEETWRTRGDISAEEGGKVTVITGGLTNALFKVDLSITNGNDTPHDPVLVRIFGADGMIDRDEETSTFARLCDQRGRGMVHYQLNLLGRFQNGRVETWISNMRQAHQIHDFKKDGLALEVARQMARLHYGFDADVEARAEAVRQPTLWSVTEKWIGKVCQQLSHERFQKDASLLEIFSIAAVGNITSDSKTVKATLMDELKWLRNQVETQHPTAPIVFCHNDVNASNILLHASIDDNGGSDELYNRGSVSIIDYEYGSINYAMYDIANFNCEHCGGNDNGMPNFELLPSAERQRVFLEEYIRERDSILSSGEDEDEGEAVTSRASISEALAEEVSGLLAQVELFQASSNMYWGIWGILQAAGEVAEGSYRMEDAGARLRGDADPHEWDNLRYGKNRLERYRHCRATIELNE